ncbi:NAD(P)-binding protein [Wilcoxina mikolae CBS 423.85]|nr:NAD(P)-binding protein [Wilcoxina mikolae CBS 423.85]
MAPLKILLLGGTGPAGIATLERLLSSPSITVIIYARNPTRIPPHLLSHPQLTLLPAGTLSDTTSLRAAVAQKPDIIISLLGPAQHDFLQWANPFAADTKQPVFADAYRVIVDAMKEYGVKRIYVMGTVSIKDPRDKPSLVGTAMVWAVWSVIHTAWKNVVAIGEVFDGIEKETGIQWTVFRLGNVTDGEMQAPAVAGYVGDGKTTLGIKRSELADWLVRQATSEVHEWAGEKPLVSSAAK